MKKLSDDLKRTLSGLAVTLFALTEAVSIGRSLAARGGYRINDNQEFIGQGLSNLAGALFSGYVATGSFNRSGLNFQAGARTPLAAMFAGSMLMVLPVATPRGLFAQSGHGGYPVHGCMGADRFWGDATYSHLIGM